MIEVINPGLHTTVQDQGRLNHRHFGVPTSGAMDQHAYILANHLLQHQSLKPVLEFTISGPTLFFYAETYIVLTGAEFDVQLNGKEITHSSPIYVPAESTLAIGQAKTGNYGYLGILEGFSTVKVLESVSYHPSINPGAKLTKDMQLLYVKTQFQPLDFNARVIPIHDKFCRTRLDVYPGPEFDCLGKDDQEKLFNHKYFVKPKSNRMAVQLGNTPDLTAPEIITAPVQPGTVQLTPSGELIILMRDAQTTGGYARILQLTDHAMNSLSQCKIGKKEEVTFHKK
ncbi:5-oxoprolinase subunit C family protein [Brumimicrobium aurantiacum]|uniref:Biotin-dependent carboxyltransferase family protein n=1 Tax=Brumimicrobium aurantiacum TaxID=1737063 RepID=A0A3E1EXE9_9FLAO|nr:biotin-dependent carboxyltransferase family protein [Brumimicrobium aurantiacum]RFC54229.1 biotin-dependent carboxyltransferase family protein [Brumimicrobium aurantiacum]